MLETIELTQEDGDRDGMIAAQQYGSARQRGNRAANDFKIACLLANFNVSQVAYPKPLQPCAVFGVRGCVLRPEPDAFRPQPRSRPGRGSPVIGNANDNEVRFLGSKFRLMQIGPQAVGRCGIALVTLGHRVEF